MQWRDALGRWLILAVLGLGFVSLLVINLSIPRPAELSERPSPGKTCSDGSGPMLADQEQIGQLDEFGIAFEDSIEIFRVGPQQPAFGIDQLGIRTKVASKVVRYTRPNISPPLLV